MPIYTDKRTGRLFVQFDYKRQTFKQYLPEGALRDQAKRLETKMKSDAFNQANGLAPPNEIAFEDAVQEYLAHVIRHADKYARAENVLIAAKPFLKGKSVRQIRVIDIERFMNARTHQPTMHGTPRKPATVWREMAVISAFFTFCIKNDYCEANPCGRIEKPRFDNVQNRVLKREDEADFLAAFDPEQGTMARDICILVLNTGLRQNDVLRLTGFQVKDGSIHLVQGKTKRTVEIPLNHIARAIVERYSGKGYLFPSPKTGKPMHYIRQAVSGACRRVNEAREKNGLPPMDAVSIRDLRRTFATRLAEDGADALTIALLLGHGDLRMVHRYARSIETMRKAVQKLEKPTPSLPDNVTKFG